jgi:ribosomal protein S18 acetylase RimI-like enzyme
LVKIQSRESGVPTIVIRFATRQDLPQLGDLVRQEVEYQQTLARSFELIPQVDWTGYISARLEHAGTEILVAEEDNELIGYIQVRLTQVEPRSLMDRLRAAVCRILRRRQRQAGRVGFIEDISVVPSKRQQGVATKLLLNSLQWFQRQHLVEIQAAIWASNEASLSFFGKIGFEPFRLMMSKRLQ